MLNVVRRVREKRRNHSVKSKSLKIRPISFRPNKFIKDYLTKMYYKSRFINRGIYFHIQMINHPEKIMKELKKRYPDKWKKVNRLKFIW